MDYRLSVKDGPGEDVVGEAAHQREAHEQRHKPQVSAGDGQIHEHIVQTEDTCFNAGNHGDEDAKKNAERKSYQGNSATRLAYAKGFRLQQLISAAVAKEGERTARGNKPSTS